MMDKMRLDATSCGSIMDKTISTTRLVIAKLSR